MIYNKNNLAVSKIAATTDERPAIAGVLFTPSRTIATDAFKMVEVGTPRDQHLVDFPSLDGVSAIKAFDPFIVDAKQVKNIKVPVNKEMPILEHVAVKVVEDKSVELMTTDLDVANITRMTRTLEDYPDTDKVIPKGKPVIEVRINADYLTDILKIVSDVSKYNGEGKKVTLKLYGDVDGDKMPVVIESIGDKQTAQGMVMPIDYN